MSPCAHSNFAIVLRCSSYVSDWGGIGIERTFSLLVPHDSSWTWSLCRMNRIVLRRVPSSNFLFVRLDFSIEPVNAISIMSLHPASYACFDTLTLTTFFVMIYHTLSATVVVPTAAGSVSPFSPRCTSFLSPLIVLWFVSPAHYAFQSTVSRLFSSSSVFTSSWRLIIASVFWVSSPVLPFSVLLIPSSKTPFVSLHSWIPFTRRPPADILGV